MTDTGALLAIIAGRDRTGLIEVRCRSPHSGRIEAREWFPCHDHAATQRFILAQSERLDVYVGAAPRTGRAGGKAAIDHAWCLWADIDTAGALDRLRAFAPAPTLIVRSGTGDNVHAWWALAEPLPAAWVERANRRLAHHLGADMKATDAARILRPPDSLNHKHDPATRVTIQHVDHGIVPVDVFRLTKNLVDPSSNPPARRVVVPDEYADDPLESMSAEHYYTTLTGRPILRGNVQCPFPSHHEGAERTPSMRLYPEGTWYCWGCAAGGSVFQFAARLWDYSLPVRGADFLALKGKLTETLT